MLEKCKWPNFCQISCQVNFDSQSKLDETGPQCDSRDVTKFKFDDVRILATSGVFGIGWIVWDFKFIICIRRMQRFFTFVTSLCDIHLSCQWCSFLCEMQFEQVRCMVIYRSCYPAVQDEKSRGCGLLQSVTIGRRKYTQRQLLYYHSSSSSVCESLHCARDPLSCIHTYIQ